MTDRSFSCRRRCRLWKPALIYSGGLAATTVATIVLGAQVPDTNGTRWMGLWPGPHAVGFEMQTRVDTSRRITGSDAGTTIGVAVWYPAEHGTTRRDTLSTLDYRLLEFANPLSAPERRTYEDDQVNSLRAWPHIGIVEMTRDQARASLHTRGMAVRGAAARPGRYPVVMVLGGQYYLSTTAELLASHGFVVFAPFRFSDLANEIGTEQFSWYLENAVRDAEWTLDELRTDPRADLRYVAAIGHGGGGMQAMLLAMRNRGVTALVGIDAGNFSSRSRGRELAFSSPRLMRAPYLYLATAATRKSQDQFEDFLAMRFSQRFEVILESPDLRHHDLSDLGRGVTAPMGIRGAPQSAVQADYALVHEIVVRFLLAQANASAAQEPAWPGWLAAKNTPGRIAVAIHPATEPAPTVAAVLADLDATTPVRLREARRRDPEAPLFQPNNLSRVSSKAFTSGDFATAAAISEFALEIHPASAIFHEQKSQALESRGDRQGAMQAATACAAIPTGNDWRAEVAVNLCKERIQRLSGHRAP